LAGAYAPLKLRGNAIEELRTILASDPIDTLVYEAIKVLAKSLTPSDLAEKAYILYEKFRPEIPQGKRGWGASGKLDLDSFRKMADSKETQSSNFRAR
jgi:hypothetical protein